MEILTSLTIGLLFGMAIFQMLSRNIIRSVIGLVLLANAINLFLLSAGAYNALVPAYTTGAGIPQRCAATGAHLDSHRHQHGRHGVRPVHALHYFRSLQDQRYGRD